MSETSKNNETTQLGIGGVSNSAICSGCNKPHSTVNRYMFDGLCADCTDKALYDYEFAKKAQARNEELIGHCC